MTLVREAMVVEPRSLGADSTAREAGELLANVDVRAVFICDAGQRLVGVVTRKTLVREVVAPGKDPNSTRLGEIAEAPHWTFEAEASVEDAFRFMEEQDAERVPVVEDGRLVGVLSRAVVQRRLAEDEPVEETV
ncbi:MAG TPA: CBS domain-containing protein [Gaiellaceae bacterium]|nr:CBS domain-containing protein [Gaiellaceae bacterium]